MSAVNLPSSTRFDSRGLSDSPDLDASFAVVVGKQAVRRTLSGLLKEASNVLIDRILSCAEHVGGEPHPAAFSEAITAVRNAVAVDRDDVLRKAVNYLIDHFKMHEDRTVMHHRAVCTWSRIHSWLGQEDVQREITTDGNQTVADFFATRQHNEHWTWLHQDVLLNASRTAKQDRVGEHKNAALKELQNATETLAEVLGTGHQFAVLHLPPLSPTPWAGFGLLRVWCPDSRRFEQIPNLSEVRHHMLWICAWL
jgi:hypothetical protein